MVWGAKNGGGERPKKPPRGGGKTNMGAHRRGGNNQNEKLGGEHNPSREPHKKRGSEKESPPRGRGVELRRDEQMMTPLKRRGGGLI